MVDAVRDRTDISQVVQRHVSLQRRGRNFVGLCPFHQEKTPSFNVIPDKGIFHCFGCQAGGDVFKFLMMLEGLSFVEAIKELAGPAGVPVEERELTPAERQALKKRATLFDVLEAAAAVFESTLWTDGAGADARAYLEQRQITPETARAWRLGFAPDGWSRLIDRLHRDGYRPEQLADAGLARSRQGGDGFYDTLRDRLIIPIRDERGRVIAFGGRIMQGDGPKYINTPESPLYEKSKVLYGLGQARQGIGQRDRVVVVEGYFDVISLHQAGFTEAVATCGTALTQDHLEKIRRLTRDLVLLMDADEAGMRAAERSLPLCVAAGIQPWRLELPGAKDPDELVRADGAEALEAAIAAREPLLEWVVARKLAAYGTSTMSRDRVLDDVLPLLVELADPALISRVAGRFGLDERIVLEKVREARRKPKEPTRARASAELPEPTIRPWTPHRDVVHILWLLVHRYDQVADLMGRVDPSTLAGHGPVQPIVARLVSGEPVASLLPDLEDVGVQRTLAAVVARDKLYSAEEAPRALCEVLIRLGAPARASQRAELSSAVEAAAKSGDLQQLQAATTTRKALVALERELEAAMRSDDLSRCLDLLATLGAQGLSPGVARR